MKDITIAIDGFSGTGKSSTAKAVATHLGYNYLDSGAMYRCVTLACLHKGVDILDEELVTGLAKKIEIEFNKTGEVFLDKEDVTHEIRSMTVNQSVSVVSSYKGVREAMVFKQRLLGSNNKVVMDGRDIGTVVFPHADLKIFMTASSEVRAKRRQQELLKKGISEELSEIQKNLISRDQMDSSRKESPLKRADNAVEIDTSDISFEAQVTRIIQLAERIIHEG